MPAGCYRPMLGPNPISSEGMAAFPAVYVAHGVSSGVAARSEALPYCLVFPTPKLSSQLLPLVASLRSFCFAFLYAKIFVVRRGKRLLTGLYLDDPRPIWLGVHVVHRVRLRCAPTATRQGAQGPRQCQSRATTARQCHYSVSQHGRGFGPQPRPGKMLAVPLRLRGKELRGGACIWRCRPTV